MHRSPHPNQPDSRPGDPETDVDPWSEFLSESSEGAPTEGGTDQTAAPAVWYGDLEDERRSDPATVALETPYTSPFADVSVAGSNLTVRADYSPAKPSSTGLVASFTNSTEPRSAQPPLASAAVLAERAVAASLGAPVERPEPLKPPAALVPVVLSLTSVEQGLSLADIIANRVPTHWSEAVAVVQEVCDVLVQSGDTHPLVPDVSDILITAAGSVHVRAEGGGDRDVRSLGRLLHSLLSTATPPLPLRLFVTSSIASPRYQSVELYADALSHYAAPGRQALIQALYHRSLKPATSVAVDVDRSTPATTRRNVRVTLAAPLAVAAVFILMAASAAGAWFFQASLRSQPQGPLAAAAPLGDASVEAAAPAVERAVSTSAAPAVPVGRDPWQRGRINGPSMRRDPFEAPVDAPVSAPPLVTLPPVTPSIPRPVLRAPAQISQPFPTTVNARSSPSVAEAQPENVGTVGTVPEDPTIYSRANYDVQPPELLTPPLSPPAIDGSASTYAIELIIDEHGTVLSARLPAKPLTFQDGNLLPPAKMARFRPARKNGVAVKYRLLMTVTRTAG